MDHGIGSPETSTFQNVSKSKCIQAPATRGAKTALSLLLLLAVACGAGATPTSSPVPSGDTKEIPTPVSIMPATQPCEPVVGQNVDAFKAKIRRIEIGSLLMTGSFDLVDVQAVFHYNIEDLDAFVSKVADPEGCPDGRTLRVAAQASLSEVVGQHSINDVLVSKRDEIERATAKGLQQILDGYEAGINIKRVLLIVNVPEEVRDAFGDVLQARQDKDSMISEAHIKIFEVLYQADLEAEQIIKTAEAEGDVRIIQAEGDAERFVSALREYEKEDAQAFKELHLKTLDGILPGISEFIKAANKAAKRPNNSNLNGSAQLTGFFESRPKQRVARVSYEGDIIINSWLTARLPSFNSQTSLDNRLLLVEVPPVAMSDKEKENLIIDSYARYRIVAPIQFRDALQTEFGARAELSEVIISALRAEIALRDRFEVIGTDIILDDSGNLLFGEYGIPRFRGTKTRSEIMDRVLVGVQQIVADRDFGIEVVDVRMNQVSFPEAVIPSIYTRMRVEQNRIASIIRGQGEVSAADIRGEADKNRTIILAETGRQADAIRAEAEARAIDIFIEALAQSPELSRYQKSLEAYKVSGIRGR